MPLANSQLADNRAGNVLQFRRNLSCNIALSKRLDVSDRMGKQRKHHFIS